MSRPPFSAGVLHRTVFGHIGRFSSRKWPVIAFFGLLPILVNPVFTLFMGVPRPQGTDEFGYLLMADTFAHGRFTNPAHPLWQHFQTFAESHHPNRTAISPPLQGIFLALGQLLFHLPIAGVWLSISLMCAAIAWMLYGWLRPTWALAGSILAFVHLGCYTYWSHTYWGGAPAAIGGCLVFGALPRLFSRPCAAYAIVLGLGCAVLANSRPLEGFVACVPAAAALTVWLLRSRLSISTRVVRVAAPIAAILALTACGIAFANRAITGDPFIFPERQAMATISSVPLFIWQKMGPEPVFTHTIFRDAEHIFARCHYTTKRSSFKGFCYWSRYNIVSFINFYLGPFLLFFLVCTLPFILSNRWLLGALFTVFLVSAVDAFGLSFLNQPNYIAPVSCLIYALAGSGFRFVYCLRIKRRRVGRTAVVYLFVIALAFAGMNLFVNMKRPAFWPWQKEHSYSRGDSRARMIKDLVHRGGTHLVIVRYGPRHHFAEEWVYNAADIDASPVVFARDLDPDSNRSLTAYFAGRHQWLLDVYDDNAPPRLQPYPPPGG